MFWHRDACSTQQHKKAAGGGGSIRLKALSVAEREGFEPSIRENRIPDFESGAFDHSATFPGILTSLIGSLLSEVRYYRQSVEQFQADFHASSFTLSAHAPGSSRAMPPMYGRNATGIVTDPSAFWPFSRIATSVRPTASPEPFNV